VELVSDDALIDFGIISWPEAIAAGVNQLRFEDVVERLHNGIIQWRTLTTHAPDQASRFQQLTVFMCRIFIVARFVAGEKLVHKLRVVAASLYVLSVFVFLSRWYYAANDAEMFESALNEVGVLVQTPWVIFFARLTWITPGTLATQIFLFRKDVYVPSDD